MSDRAFPIIDVQDPGATRAFDRTGTSPFLDPSGRAAVDPLASNGRFMPGQAVRGAAAAGRALGGHPRHRACPPAADRGRG